MYRICKNFKNVRLQNIRNAASVFPQVTPHSHPWLFSAADQIQPGIKKSEYSLRRSNVMSSLHLSDKDLNAERVGQVKIPDAYNPDAELPTKYCLLLAGNCLTYKSEDIPYEAFHQNADFNYLCGYLEPGSILLLETTMGRDIKSTLFVPQKDERRAIYEGKSPALEEVQEFTGVHQVLDMERDFFKYARSLLNDDGRPTQFFVNQGTPTNFDTQMRFMRPFLAETKPHEHITVVVADPFIAELRLFKSDAEQALLRESAGIAANAINAVREQLESVQNESQVRAALGFAANNFAPPGCQMTYAYPSQVARQDRACRLHYSACNGELDISRDTALVDFGINFHGYISDVARCFGFKQEPHQEIYNILYKVQGTLIEMLVGSIEKKSGAKNKVTLNSLHRAMQVMFLAEMQKLGFADGNYEKLTEVLMASVPHHVGHFIGLDVHDTPMISKDTTLRKGMAFTLEPGLYLPDHPHVPEQYRNIGMRIEDCILIDSQGKVEVLSHAAVKDPKLLF